jgi:hypothetical protein
MYQLTHEPRYLRLSIRAGLAKDPNFHWCIGPECENGQIHDGSGGDIFSCAACGYRSCSKCERPWHQDETCDQYTARLNAVDGNEAASAAFISSNTKECPSCKSRIQKDGGCDHMTCRKCRNQFCWLCSADYKDIHRQGNTAHATSCQYHSGNIPDPHGVPLGGLGGRGLGGRRLVVHEQPAWAGWQAPLALPGQPVAMPPQQPPPAFGLGIPQYQAPPAMFMPQQIPQQPVQQLGFQDPNVNQWLAGINPNATFAFQPQGAHNPGQAHVRQHAINARIQRARDDVTQAHQARFEALRQAQQAREAQAQAQLARLQRQQQMLREQVQERIHGRRLG